MASGGGPVRTLGDARGDAAGDGRGDDGGGAATVGAAVEVLAGLSTVVDGLAAVEGVTSATGVGDTWPATLPQPVTTRITPATRATEVLARSTPS